MNKQFLEELESLKFEVCRELVATPFFMYVTAISLKSRLKQINSIIKLAKKYQQ